MADRDDLAADPPGWWQDGIYRAAYLYNVFDPEDRERVRRAGIAIAGQALSGDTNRTAHDPFVVGNLRAAAEDLRMCRLARADKVGARGPGALPLARPVFHRVYFLSQVASSEVCWLPIERSSLGVPSARLLTRRRSERRSGCG